jgi:hypothetical protein
MTVLKRIAGALVEFFGSLLGVESVIDRPINSRRFHRRVEDARRSYASAFRGAYGDAKAYVDAGQGSWEKTAVYQKRILALVAAVFDDPNTAAKWLTLPKARFDGRSPLDLLTSSAGAKIVEEVLIQSYFGNTA